MNSPSELREVVVDEADGLIRVIAAGFHVAHDPLGCVAGAEHEHALAGVRAHELGEDAAGHPHAAEHQHEQARVGDVDRARIHCRPDRRVRDGIENHRAHADAANQRLQIVDARVAPESLVEAERDERERAGADQPWQHLQERRYRPRRRMEVEAQQECEGVRRDDDERLQADRKRTMEPQRERADAG